MFEREARAFTCMVRDPSLRRAERFAKLVGNAPDTSQESLRLRTRKASPAKMAEVHVYFFSALVLSCCLQILAGYLKRALLYGSSTPRHVS